jgi:chlorite dismutase
MAAPNPIMFSGGSTGRWSIRSITPVRGACVPPAVRLDVSDATAAMLRPALWRFRGVSSHLHYTTRAEADALAGSSAPANRPDATFAALIPIKKSAAWWALAQDERREILAEGSRHVAIGMEYSAAITRALFHGRAICDQFDFVTWFEYPPEDEPRFEELVGRLRATPEWTYVEREIDLRLALAG